LWSFFDQKRAQVKEGRPAVPDGQAPGAASQMLCGSRRTTFSKQNHSGIRQTPIPTT
jgi:hypothetical protein